MICYGYDKSGYYTGTRNCQRDPLESIKKGEEIYLLPANSTYDEPLEEKEGYKVKYVDGAWVYEEVVVPVEYEPTDEDKQAAVRSIRDGLINSISWRLERYEEELALGLETTDSADDILKIKQYRQYLRDYTKVENWFENNPLTYTEWLSV